MSDPNFGYAAYGDFTNKQVSDTRKALGDFDFNAVKDPPTFEEDIEDRPEQSLDRNLKYEG